MSFTEDIRELKNIVMFSVALYEDLKQDSECASYSTMMGLFATMIEQCDGFVKLMENKSYICTQPITRAMLEAYVDVLNIKKNGNYVGYLWAEYYNREKELSKTKSKQKELRIKRNDSFERFSSSTVFETLSISEKFKLADFGAGYKSIYPLLSAHTHSGVFALLNRVIEEGENNKLSKQKLFKSSPSQTEALAIPLMSNCLIDVCEIVAEGHDVTALKKVKLLRRVLVNKSS